MVKVHCQFELIVWATLVQVRGSSNSVFAKGPYYHMYRRNFIIFQMLFEILYIKVLKINFMVKIKGWDEKFHDISRLQIMTEF